MIKKIAFSFLSILSLISCNSTAQKKAFTKNCLSQKLFSTENTEVAFKQILKKHSGKTIVIEVWASWCGDCVKAMPKIKELQTNYTNTDFVFISMDKAFDKWKAGIEKHELIGDHYWAADGMKGEFGKSINLDWIPRYIIIDKKGKIIIYRAIETDFDKINDTLKTLQ